MEAVREEASKAQDALAKYTEKHPDGLLAHLSSNHKRRLQSLSALNLMIDRQQERMQVGQGGQGRSWSGGAGCVR